MSQGKTLNRSGQSDRQVVAIRSLLDRTYKVQHPEAEIDIRRYNRYSIRVRVIDPAFRGMSRVDRDDRLRAALDELSEEIQADLTMLLLLAPEETKTSLVNLEFEDPSPPQGLWP